MCEGNDDMPWQYGTSRGDAQVGKLIEILGKTIKPAVFRLIYLVHFGLFSP